jgi:hypothetical protein
MRVKTFFFRRGYEGAVHTDARSHPERGAEPCVAVLGSRGAAELSWTAASRDPVHRVSATGDDARSGRSPASARIVNAVMGPIPDRRSYSESAFFPAAPQLVPSNGITQLTEVASLGAPGEAWRRETGTCAILRSRLPPRGSRARCRSASCRAAGRAMAAPPTCKVTP